MKDSVLVITIADRQYTFRQLAEIVTSFEREHKWLNDAATSANSDLDQVASVVERLKAERDAPKRRKRP